MQVLIGNKQTNLSLDFISNLSFDIYALRLRLKSILSTVTQILMLLCCQEKSLFLTTFSVYSMVLILDGNLDHVTRV